MSHQDEQIFVRITGHDGSINELPYMDKQDAQSVADAHSARSAVKSAEVIVKRDQLSDALNTLATSIEKLCEAIEKSQQPTPNVTFDSDVTPEQRNEFMRRFSGNEVSSDLHPCRTRWSSAGDEPGTVNTCGKSDAYHAGDHIDFTTGARLPRFRVRP